MRRKRTATLLAVLGLAAGGYVAARALDQGASSGDSALQPEVGQSSEERTSAPRRPVLTRQHRQRPRPLATADLLTNADRSSFRRLEQELGGASGVAISGVGFKQHIEVTGSLQEEVAWSTIKVPIAVAIESRAQGQPTASEEALLRRAITASDNAAAEALWTSLGDPAEAGSAVQKILTSAGDPSTRVETRVLRPGFSSSGQTRWSLTAQEQFIGALPCLPYAEPVLSLMRQIVPEQRWGLGSLRVSAQFKGGWGPGLDGRYLVRQMGILRLPSGRLLAVSMATNVETGSFATGSANLTRIARWIIDHVDAGAIPPSACKT